MSLDLTTVAAQVIAMIAGLKDTRAEQEKHLRFALDTLGSPAIDLDALKKKIKAGKTTWLVADIVEGLNKRYPLPPTPPDFTVIATDGSHIDVDRHHSTRCYLINIGSVAITLRQPARTPRFPALPAFTPTIKTWLSPPRAAGASSPWKGLSWASSAPSRNAAAWPTLPPVSRRKTAPLALLDGTLILWGLEAYPEFVTRRAAARRPVEMPRRDEKAQ